MRVNRYARGLIALLALSLVTAVCAAQQSKTIAKSLLDSDQPADNGDVGTTGGATEEEISLLRQKLQRSQDQLRATERVMTTGPLLLERTQAEQAERFQLQRRLISTYQKHLDTLVRLQQLQQSRKDLEAEAQQGLDSPPPYSIDKVDSLWSDVLTKLTEIQTATSSLRFIETLYSNQRELLEQNEQAARKAQEALEKADSRQEAAAEPLHTAQELAALQVRQAQAEVTALEAERRFFQESIAYHKRTLTSLRSRAEQAALSSPLAAADQQAKLDQIKKRRQKLKTQTRKVISNLQAAQDSTQATRNSLKRAREKIPDEKLANEKELSLLASLQARLDARKIQATTAALTLETLRLLDDSLTLAQQVWIERFEAARTETPEALREALKQVRQYMESMTLVRERAQSRLNATFALLESQQKHLAGLKDDDPVRKYANNTLSSYQKRIELLNQQLTRNAEVQGLLRRWLEEIKLFQGSQTIFEKASELVDIFGERMVQIWNYELFYAEDTIEVEGKKITGKRGITVSKIVVILVVVTLGTWITGKISRGLRRLLIRRFKMYEGQALLIQRIAYLSLIFIIVIFALTTFKIPFTLFAFLGGALAIGIGFGAQNLINNFISGLILLIERPFNLGDIVEVKGIRGKVESIGARYSEIRRADGIDILIPNSALLENNVTNWTLSNKKIRISFTLGVGYGYPAHKVSELLHQAVEEHDKALQDPGPTIRFDEFGENARVFSVNFWVMLDPSEDYKEIASDVRSRIEPLLQEAGVTLANPQRHRQRDT